MKVYSTKNCLTRGIVLIDGTPDRRGTIAVQTYGGYRDYFTGQWFAEYGLALADAEMRRRKAIKSAHRKLAKLRALKFEEPK